MSPLNPALSSFEMRLIRRFRALLTDEQRLVLATFDALEDGVAPDAIIAGFKEMAELRAKRTA